jgi:hypothetical protein
MKISFKVVRDRDHRYAENKWMVEIRHVDEGNRLIGVPLRGVDKDTAEYMQYALRYSFEYALSLAQRTAHQALGRIECVWEKPEDREC